VSTLATTPAGTIRVLTTRGGSISEFSTFQRTWYLRKISSRLLLLVASLKKSSRSAALSAWPLTKNSKCKAATIRPRDEGIIHEVTRSDSTTSCRPIRDSNTSRIARYRTSFVGWPTSGAR